MTAERNAERVAGSAFVTAAAQVVSMALGAALAVVVVLEFGKNARTDGLFAAYGVYGFVLLVARASGPRSSRVSSRAIRCARSSTASSPR